jgi:hypothetical protein
MTLFLAAALSTLLQANPQSQQAQQPPKASIEGFVVRAGTNEPISRARITITRTSSPQTPQPVASPNIPVVTTDSQGRFTVKDLDPGSYVLNAVRNGFARQQYGERAPGRPGTPLSIGAGQALKDLVFRLVPAATISGRISDPTGEPLAGITVQVLRSTYDGTGRRTFQPVGTAHTDDRGEYRVYWITPGRYYVAAGSGGWPIDIVLVNGVNSNEYVEPGYVQTFYPGTTDSSSAAAIELQPGTEIRTIDFTLRQQQVYQIRGRLFDARTGQFPKMASFTLMSRTPGAPLAPPRNSYNGANGTFELRDVPPGAYWLRAIAIDTSAPPTAAHVSRNAAQIPIDVSNADVANVVLAFTPGFSVAGRIAMDDGSPVQNPERLRVMLAPTEPTMFSPPPTLRPDATFLIENIQPGDYRISVSPLPPNTYIKSVQLGQTDVAAGVAISGPVSDGLAVVLGTKPGEIAGRVVDKEQKPMRGIQGVLIPDRQRGRRELYRTAISDQNGQFTIRNVAPGDYKLFAWEDLEPFAYNDPDFLRKYEDRAVPVKVSESSKLSVEARIIPAGQ